MERMSATGNADTAGAFGLANFVGSMGDRFKGGSAAGASASDMLQGMQGGGGGAVGNLFALQAAGLGQSGVSYADAWMRVQRGSAAGGVGLRDVLKQFERLPVVQAYLASGRETDLNTAVLILSRLLPQYKPTDIEALLRTMTSKGYKTGAVFDGPGKHNLLRMSDALTKGTLPTKEGELIASEINNNAEWSTEAIGASSQHFSNMPETQGTIDDAAISGAAATGNAGLSVMQQYGDIAGVQSYGGGGGGGSRTSADFMNKNVNPGRGFTGPTSAGGHPGVDINVMPGQEVRSSVEGVVTHVKRGHGIEIGYNCFIRETGTNIEFRFFHMDPRKKPHSIIRGARVSHGTLLGYGAPQKMFKNGMQVHTHVGAFPGGGNNPIDPTGVTNLQEVISPSGESQPSSGVTSPSAAGGNGGPSAMNNSVDVNVYVYDGRISVQKVASKSKKAGDANRMYGNKG
jgi:hypothetical protein